jgi:hypothetical protein
MILTSSLYEACGDLFAAYPLAVEALDQSGSVCSMVLMREDRGDAQFFVLTQDHAEGQPLYSLSSWRAPGCVDIGPGADAIVPEAFASVVAEGVPIPRHGSLFGWDDEGVITALIPVFAQYTPTSPEPSWATMPLVGIPETHWPPFVGERLLGRWFWEHYRAGNIIALDCLIAATRGAVFWADTVAILGSGCCVVAHDIRGSGGHTLQRGSYVYFQALRAGKPVPPLSVLLADSGNIDLAPWFQQTGHSEGRAQGGS